MPHFHFHLRAGGTIHLDPNGSECLDLAAARSDAVGVAMELMRNAESERRHWSIRVEDGHGAALFDVFFADVDPSLDSLPPEWQQLRAQTARHYAGLVDVLLSTHATVTESRMLIARARRRPQLVYARNSRTGLTGP